MGEPTGAEVAGAIGLMSIPFIAFFIIWVLFLLSLSKLVNETRINDLPQTYISKVWVWTQLIPFWGYIALIVINIKLDTAVRAIESKYELPFKTISYPAVFGWLVILGFLYAWIPVVGIIANILFMIIFWIKVSSTTKQLISIKNQEINN